MKKKILLLFSVVCILLCLVGCTKNTHDSIEVYNKTSTIFDDITIDIKDGYFYDRHEKFIVDEDTVGVTVYFSTENNEWKEVEKNYE